MTERSSQLRQFVGGLVGGAAVTLIAVLSLSYWLIIDGRWRFRDSNFGMPNDWLQWASMNLGTSIPIFALLTLAYFITLGKLQDALNHSDSKDITRIVHFDQLTDVWTALFFGTGVIWTAIGMRSALIFALADRTAALQQGAFAMLERMVEGGILLALSTTIFGGIGGYLMRVYKTVTLGTRLQKQYEMAAREDALEIRASLGRIEEHMQS